MKRNAGNNFSTTGSGARGNYNLVSYDKIPSTQTAALEMIASGGAADKTVIMAAAQSAGHGRNSRKWVSHHGNLYASFIYKISEKRPTLSYAFAVAAAETLLSLGVPVRIKWPNDLLADGKKISGLLLEYCRDFLVVGIGINIRTSPTLENYKAAKTDDYAKGLTPNAVINKLITSFEKWRSVEFPTVRKRWMELSIDMNSNVSYRDKSAVFCGLSEDGAMVLRKGERYELVYGDEAFA
jgi:BirA family biotin operon repressor/biotin-[acetyl-CoA-carboxylase] ligase